MDNILKSLMAMACSVVLSAYPSTGFAQQSTDELELPPLSGKATFRWFGIKVYDIALYLDEAKVASNEKGIKDFDSVYLQTPLALQITYDMDIDAKDLVDNTLEQWQEIDYGKSEACSNQQQWAKQTNQIWPDIKSGDTLVLAIDENQNSGFWHNGSFIGRINDKNFGSCFVAIWLAKDTTEKKLRRKLLAIIK